MKAIRVDGHDVMHGKTHIDLVFDYQSLHNLSEEALEEMLSTDRFEFGAVFLNKQMKLEFSMDDSRTSLYKSQRMLWECKPWNAEAGQKKD